jgi:2-polyprenyl-3-methyl-5-hydroxy-6-metoxy-1,4-benzoquinol methylase
VAFWDSMPDQAVKRELPLFRDAFDLQLPLIDVGCGNGTQTRGLADAFARVIGVDVSEEALRGACVHHAAANVEYRALDLLDEPARQCWGREISLGCSIRQGLCCALRGARRS